MISRDAIDAYLFAVVFTIAAVCFVTSAAIAFAQIHAQIQQTKKP